MRLLAVAALTLNACAVAIPTVTPTSAASGPSSVELEVCRLDGEVRDRSLFSGIDELSFEPWKAVTGSVVVKHPSGLLIIDPAFGSQVDEDLRPTPLWFKLLLGSPDGKRVLPALLREAGLDERAVRWVALTHVHWDHAGGLRDLPASKVLLSQVEWEHLKTLKGPLDHGVIPRHFQLPPARFSPFGFELGPRDGFDASHDLFGDGSVVAFPLPGHTPGSTGYLVQGSKGRRWLFIGDASWTMAGVTRPAGKMLLASLITDFDRVQTAHTLGLLHALQRARPDLTLVPAHDLETMQTVPRCEPTTASRPGR